MRSHFLSWLSGVVFGAVIATYLHLKAHLPDEEWR